MPENLLTLSGVLARDIFPLAALPSNKLRLSTSFLVLDKLIKWSRPIASSPTKTGITPVKSLASKDFSCFLWEPSDSYTSGNHLF
jgi:hypothetical protein